MDLARLGLTRRPFRPTPDTDGYVPAPAHEAAAAAVRAAFDAGDGLALLDGDPGTGKTLVALRFLGALDGDVPRVLVHAARFGKAADLHQAILFDLGKPYVNLGEHELRLAVAEHLLAELAAGRRTVAVIDEAQNLGPDLLEEVRLLGNLESRAGKAAFVLLVAQPGLRDRLARPESAAVAQRLAVRCRLVPLTDGQSGQYLRGQIEAAGGEPERVLTDEAAALIAARCGGVPRLLNRVAALTLALAEEFPADAEPALEALARAGLAGDDADEPAEPLPAAEAARPRAAAGKPAGERGQPAKREPPKQRGRKPAA